MRLGSGNSPYEPNPLLLMRSTRPAGTTELRKVFTCCAAASTDEASPKSHGMWQSLSFSKFMTGAVRERLQNGSSGRSFPTSSMNDFPIPEDPPVTTTAEKVWSASRDEGTSFDGGISVWAGGLPRLAENQTKRSIMNR